MTWEVHTKGGPNRSSFEIAVLRSDNQHGKASYGWFDSDKLLVSHNGGPCQWPVNTFVWERLLSVAEQLAAHLNRVPESAEQPNVE
jgi:hypothetical protein